MDIKQLESFITVVNEKSFSRAAEKLFMTQPTITNHIQNLENELETTLLNRTNKNISLTDSGKILFEHAVNIINIKETVQYELNKLKGKIEGHLAICSSSIPSQYILPPIMKSFTDEFPGVTFSINQKNSLHVIEEIMSGHINYGIVGGKYDYASLEYIDFFDDHLVLAAPSPKKYLGDPYTTLDFSTLATEKFLVREEGSSTRRLIENGLKQLHKKVSHLNAISYVEDNETIKQLVSLNVGISFISEIAIKKEIALNLITPYLVKDMPLNRKFYFVYHKNRYLSPLDQAFRDYIIQYARGLEL
jgi:DNA-binding transcriptional LysR family regulator